MKIAVFDVGGTFIKYALSDEEGNFTKQGKKPTPATSHKDFLATIQAVLQEFGDVDGLAFSLPGFINGDSGYISVGGSLRYHDDYEFVKEMEAIFHLPVTVQNDAKCAAMAELWKGEAGKYKNSVVLVFGTGIGGALIQEGSIYLGSHYMSSELSCVISRDLQTYGYDAILGNRLGIPRLMKGISEKLGKDMSGEEIFALYKEGHALVCEELNAYFAKAAVELFNFQCFYDPDAFFIGGGISEEPLFVRGIQEAMKQLYKRIPYKIPPVTVLGTTLKADANLVGALYHYRKKQLSKA